MSEDHRLAVGALGKWAARTFAWKANVSSCCYDYYQLNSKYDS